MIAYVLRPATEADAPMIAAVDRACGTARDLGHDAWVRDVLSLGSSWIAEVDGVAAGYVLASRRFYGRPFVDLLAVAPAWRRQGLGARLMAKCESAHEDDRLFTSTNTSNTAMRALLAREDYAPSGTIDNLDPGDPELVFVKFRLPA
jgi:GNAT superfamily N-acetyltransferase